MMARDRSARPAFTVLVAAALACSSLLCGTMAGRVTTAAEACDPRAAAREIDALLEAFWRREGVAPAMPADDATFLRRVFLDLAGRIPTSAEAEAFLDSNAADKRAAVIDDLLASEAFVSNFFNLWADILRFKSRYVNRANVIEAAYAAYLKESIRTNKPYDVFVRELLAAKGYAWENGAIGYYHRDPEMPLDNMALTARVFLGTRIECAQCHDHPFDKWKQTDFYHLAAFTHSNKSFHQAFDAQRAAMRRREEAIDADYHREKAAASDGGAAAQRRRQELIDALDNRGVAGLVKGPVGQLFSPIGLARNPDSVLKLPDDYAQADGEPGEVMAPATLLGLSAPVAAGADPAEAFARWVASPDNPRFTRVIVNRLWKRLFGVPLARDYDDLKDDSVATVPELEEHLVRLLIDLKYDQRAFLAVLANTRAYQSATSSTEFVPGEPFHFTGPALRRMTAEQAWDSLVALASHEPDARDLAREAAEARRIQVSRMALDAYVAFDGERLLQMAFDRLDAERALDARELEVAEALAAAKREGDAARVKELQHQGGELARERSESFVNDFIMPMLTHLAQRTGGPDAVPSIDPTYVINTNPRSLPTETWRRMHVPGYGPTPKSPAELAAAAQAETDRLRDLAGRLGVAAAETDAFVEHCRRAATEWRRASELESPAPRGHLLRTLGQSDREFVENANPGASISQALAMMNGDLFSERGLLGPHAPLMLAVRRAATPEDRVEAIYLAVVTRRPTADERAACVAALASGLEPADLASALLNTKRFLFVQ